MTPQQKNLANNLIGKGLTKEQKAQQIADACNQAGITKDQFEALVGFFNKK